jgi:hypothetical protein
MKRCLILLSAIASIASAFCQEKLPREVSLQYVSILTNYTKEIRSTPIPTHPDFTKPVAVRYEGCGGMVLPETKLSAETFTKVGSEVTSVGQLWMANLSPVNGDKIVPLTKLHMVRITHDDRDVDAACCALGVRKATGGLELLIYGKSTTPVLSVPLKAISGSQPDPIDMIAERSGDNGTITLSFAGKYQASFKVRMPEQN